MNSSAGSKGRTVDGRALVAALQSAVKSLPTASEKQELRLLINELVLFLTDLRDSLDLIPAIEDAAKAERALEALGELFRRAEDNSTLAIALGVGPSADPGRSKGRRSSVTPERTEQEPVQVQGLLERLRQQPVESIRRELEAPEHHSLAILRGIATQLGIRGTAKLSRETMAHQISMKIANFRGYQSLRGDDDTGRSAT